MKPFERIMVATDFSAGAAGAGEVAAQLAKSMKVSVDVITVVDTRTFDTIYGDEAYRKERRNDIHAQARSEAQEFVDRHFKGVDAVKVHVRDGDTFLEILQAAKDLGCDMIVMGTHGRTGLAHVLIGSVTEKVVRKSPIPVVTVRGQA